MSGPRRGLRTAATVLIVPSLLALGACTGPTDDSTEPAAEVATDTEAVTSEGNARVPEGASWTQHYFPSSDDSGTELHADVLLPEGLEEGEQVPVILSVGNYFSHIGQMAAEGLPHTGPSARFTDLVEGGELMQRGYAFVMVDLRGSGGSSGCMDFMGAGEQADVGAAVDWAAGQPWSSGSVGMYGKSYDAITGLVGNNLDQDALKAVVAQEPIWDLQRNIWSNGIPRTTTVNVSTTYNSIAALPGMPDDDERYRTNAAYETEHPECAALNSFGYQTGGPDTEYWQMRDLAAGAAGTDTPLFVTQGFLEWNTEPEGMQEFLENHQGPQRGWLGQWDHKRGNDRVPDGRLEMGREGWFAEVMSFYDQHLKGVEPTTAYPPYSVQDSTGAWRAQDTWPVVEREATIELDGGSYLDDGDEIDPASTENSFVQRSEPLEQDTRITGTPRVSVDAEGHGTLMVRLHDVAPDGNATLFDEQVSVLRPGRTELELKSTDWTLPAGHQLAVEIGTVQPGPLSDWLDSPSGETVEVTGGRLQLALDDPADDVATEGEPAVYLETYRGLSTAPLPAGEPGFTLPAARG